MLIVRDLFEREYFAESALLRHGFVDFIRDYVDLEALAEGLEYLVTRFAALFAIENG